jgi:hypothetical protein
MIALLFALVVPPDTVLTEILLVTTSERIVVEAIQEDSTLLLPALALHDLLGVAFPMPWVSLDQLRRAYPTLVVQWSKEMNQVAIFDELHVLPATRRFYESHRAHAFGTAAIPAYSGLFGAFSVDDQKRALLDLGYLWKGRVSLAGRVDDAGVGQWNVSVAPWSRLFLNAMGGTGQPTSLSGRVQAGPVWISTSYTEHRPVEVAGLVRHGAVQAFASTQYGVLTLSPPGPVTVQLAQRWVDHRTVGRISFGPTFASPFSFPVASLSR